MTKTFRHSKTYRFTMAILLGGACVWLGYGMYEDISVYESGDSGLSLNIILMIAYDLLGKWGALSAWAVVSSICIWLFCFSPKAKGEE